MDTNALEAAVAAKPQQAAITIHNLLCALEALLESNDAQVRSFAEIQRVQAEIRYPSLKNEVAA